MMILVRVGNSENTYARDTLKLLNQFVHKKAFVGFEAAVGSDNFVLRGAMMAVDFA
ncbi:hypothetical protein D3C79_1117920 [compost metagenome]